MIVYAKIFLLIKQWLFRLCYPEITGASCIIMYSLHTGLLQFCILPDVSRAVSLSPIIRRCISCVLCSSLSRYCTALHCTFNSYPHYFVFAVARHFKQNLMFFVAFVVRQKENAYVKADEM